MEDLDSLLADLKQTNERIVNPGSTRGSYQSSSPDPGYYEPPPPLPRSSHHDSPSDLRGDLRFNSGTRYSPSASPGGSSGEGGRISYGAPQKQAPPPPRHQSPYSSGGGGLQANMLELNQMLAGLDQPDFVGDVRRRSEEYSKNPQSRNGKLGDSDRTSSAGPAAAHHAARELDELMVSLNQFKLRQQAEGDSYPDDYETPLKNPSSSEPQPQSDLDLMLGNLSSDISKQGVDTSAKGNCGGCNKPIVGKMITALGRCWHLEHFVCTECRENLGSQSFYERDQMPYCETCYQNLFSPKCAYCDQPILDKCLTAMDQAWHPEHFFCTNCQRPFEEGIGFHEKNNKPFCPDCFYESYGPKCGGCAKPITDTYISALNTHWHNHCFVCQDCGKGFGGGSFFDLNGLPYCETHYHAKRGSLCAACQQPVTGRCINALGRKYHPEHFVCSFCLKELNKGTFKEQSEKPYCHECFIKLFG